MPGSEFEVRTIPPRIEPRLTRNGKFAARPKTSAVAAVIALGVTVLSAISCATLGPSLPKLISSTPSPQAQRSWSVAEIPKPSPTQVQPTPTANVEPATATVLPELSPTATTEERAVISMEIVDEGQETPSPGSAPGATNANGKYVLVSITEQHLYAYENGQLVYSFMASTGMGNSTRVGSFHVLDKIPNAYGANWNIWMPNWMGIYWSGSLENGIHALPILPGGGRLWAGFLGTPISYGCVVLGVDEAMQLYEWADIGTPVDIQW